MKKTQLLHPFIFLTASLTYLYAASSVIASPDQAIRSFILLHALLLLLVFPAYWLTRDWNWAGLLLSVIAVAFFSSALFFQAVLIVVATISVFRFAYLYLRKIPMRNFRADILLNISGSALLVLILFASVSRSGISISDLPHIQWDDRALPASLVAQDESPDIYYVVLDGYAREDVLNELYGYDNSEFIEALEARGFFIPADARSNYPKTALSIASTLNMNYILELVPWLKDKDTHYWWLTSPLVRQSDTHRMLENIGYRTYSITTGWGPTEIPTADEYNKPRAVVINDFESVLLAQTPLRLLTPVLAESTYLPSFNAHRELVLFNLETLENISTQSTTPKFVVAHILAPHPPFVFDEQGNALTPNYRYSLNDATDIAITDDEYRAQYVAQMKYLNKKILDMVDEVLENSSTPPIIILQADHGPGMLTDFASADETCLRERFSIFAAYHLPGDEPPAIPADITPVNLFRIIFNGYFGTDFGPLPRKHYYMENSIHLFKHQDVTDRVDTCAQIP